MRAVHHEKKQTIDIRDPILEIHSSEACKNLSLNGNYHQILSKFECNSQIKINASLTLIWKNYTTRRLKIKAQQKTAKTPTK